MSYSGLDPRETLLVVVDVQEKLAPAMPAAAMTDLVRASTILLEAARLLGVRVVATEQYPQGLGPTLAPIAERLAALGVTPISKLSFSACGEPAFLGAVHSPRPRAAVVIGMETHICVYQTVRDLQLLGVDVHVPRDGVASRRDDHRDAGLDLCRRAGAAVTTAETVAFDWLGRASGDAFKAISRLVR
jgi:nicotinamidase-related amidase